MSSLSRRACYKCGNVGHYAEVCSSAERLCYNCEREQPLLSFASGANHVGRQAAWYANFPSRRDSAVGIRIVVIFEKKKRKMMMMQMLY